MPARLIISIDDPEDPRIAAYRDIRERDLVGRQDCFLAEGKVVLRVLFQQPAIEPVSALVLDRRLEGMTGVLADAPAGMPVYVATQPVLDRIAGFHLHRGILALARKPHLPSAAELLAGLRSRATIVVAVGISNHDNIGAIFRNAAALGADAVLLDDTSSDPLYRKAIRVSVGATLKVPTARMQPATELLDLVVASGFAALALTPAGSEDIASILPEGRIALFLGSEGEGLPAALIGRMRGVRIAMAPGFDSLNVATAGAIALHRLAAG